MGQNWDRDPATGDYIMKNGSPLETDSLRIPAYTRLKVRATQWLYAPDKNYGSYLFRLKKRQTNRDTTEVENICANALRPLTADGRANQIDIEFDAVARNGVGLSIKLKSDAGAEDELKLNPLGA